MQKRHFKKEEIPDICDLQTEFNEYEMKNLIKCWEGPMIDDTYASMIYVARCSDVDFFMF